jgi:hypothetical protein
MELMDKNTALDINFVLLSFGLFLISCLLIGRFLGQQLISTTQEKTINQPPAIYSAIPSHLANANDDTVAYKQADAQSLLGMGGCGCPSCCGS